MHIVYIRKKNKTFSSSTITCQMWLNVEAGIVVSGIASTVLYIVVSLVNGLSREVGFMIIDLFTSWNCISPYSWRLVGQVSLVIWD